MLLLVIQSLKLVLRLSKVYQDHDILQISPTIIHPGFTHQINNHGSLFYASDKDYLYLKTLLDLLI